MNHDISIMIAVLTYRREYALDACVKSIQASANLIGRDVSIVIGDNDPDSSVDTYSGKSNVSRVYLGKGSIAGGRQDMLCLARKLNFGAIIFVDDDENVSLSWLDALLTVALIRECSAVAGPVIPTGISAKELSLHRRARRHSGTSMSSAGAGNLLLIIEKIQGIDFDVSWPLLAGEDTDFTHRITRRGGIILWADEAEIYEAVHDTRRRRLWILKRFFYNGRILYVVKTRNNGLLARYELLQRGFGAAAFIPLFPFALISNSVLRLILDRGIRQFGFLYQAIFVGKG